MKKMFNTFKNYVKKHSWWQITLAVIGILAIISVIIKTFTPIGKNIYPLTLSAPVSIPDQSFIPTLVHLTQAQSGKGGTVSIKNNGDEFFTAVVTDLQNAKKTITVSSYIWEDGRMSEELFATLIKKQQEGVEVRVLIDAFGGKGLSEENIKKLENPGGKVAVFRPVAIGKISRFHQRNHRRSFVIDGAIAYTGGIGIADKWLGNARNEEEWRDMMFRLTGPLASATQASFAELWTSTTGEVLVGESFFAKESKQVNQNEFIALAVNPEAEISPLSKLFTTSILSAQSSVDIITPYLIPDKALQDALIKKAKEGITIRLIVPNENTDTPSVRWASQNFYTPLLKAGVRIYEYQPTFIHSKVFVADNVWSIIGSANLDNRSLSLNHESVIGIKDTALANELKKVFENDLANTKEITLEEWESRSVFKRIPEILSRIFVQQF
jgi:cardiolipin synthase A/B